MTSVLALGRWPEWLTDIIVTLHEKAYFEWADTREFTPRCFVCTQPILVEPHVVPGKDLAEEVLRTMVSTIFCSPECRAKFEEHVRRSRTVMPPPVGFPTKSMDDLRKTLHKMDEDVS